MNDAWEEVNLGNHKKETERNQTFDGSNNLKLEYFLKSLKAIAATILCKLVLGLGGFCPSFKGESHYWMGDLYFWMGDPQALTRGYPHPNVSAPLDTSVYNRCSHLKEAIP